MDTKGVMILAKDQIYSMDCSKTQLNNNVLVVGASGSGKTRGIVCPNILTATGSYVISDPKGNLYHKYKKYLESMGYTVQKLDFTDPLNSAHYNFLSYIKEPKDIIKSAHMLSYQEICNRDPFWDQTSSMLLSSLISYCIEFLPPEEQNFRTIERLLQNAKRDECSSNSASALDRLMKEAAEDYPDSFAVNQYNNVAVAPERTYNSIIISLTAKLRNFASEEIIHMMSSDEIDIASLGKQKKAVFVVVSDTDRSMDVLANLFFTQAINELCRYADTECRDYTLPVPVRFILDDFATNCIIDDFPRMISSIRSRGISVMLMIQSESQLARAYSFDKDTVIGNCDTYVYLGCNDVETATKIAQKVDIPLKKILNMPIGSNVIFRRGSEPVIGKNVVLEELEKSFGFENVTEEEQRFHDDRPLWERLSGKRKSIRPHSEELQKSVPRRRRRLDNSPKPHIFTDEMLADESEQDSSNVSEDANIGTKWLFT